MSQFRTCRVRTDRFDITAKADGSSRPDLAPMLQRCSPSGSSWRSSRHRAAVDRAVRARTCSDRDGEEQCVPIEPPSAPAGRGGRHDQAASAATLMAAADLGDRAVPCPSMRDRRSRPPARLRVDLHDTLDRRPPRTPADQYRSAWTEIDLTVSIHAVLDTRWLRGACAGAGHRARRAGLRPNSYGPFEAESSLQPLPVPPAALLM